MKATLTYQNYGTAILIFIKGETYEDAYSQYLSLYNWNATSSDERQVSETIIACWSTIEKFQAYLFNLHENRLLAAGKRDAEAAQLARVLAKEQFDATPYESYRSVHNDFEIAEFGQMTAEKEDRDFKDEVLAYAMTRRED